MLALQKPHTQELHTEIVQILRSMPYASSARPLIKPESSVEELRDWLLAYRTVLEEGMEEATAQDRELDKLKQLRRTMREVLKLDYMNDGNEDDE